MAGNMLGGMKGRMALIDTQERHMELEAKTT